MPGAAAATGKVRPLTPLQVVGIAPSGFRASAGRWADAEQSTSPKIDDLLTRPAPKLRLAPSGIRPLMVPLRAAWP
jgi:hypothetical protein